MPIQTVNQKLQLMLVLAWKKQHFHIIKGQHVLTGTHCSDWNLCEISPRVSKMEVQSMHATLVCVFCSQLVDQSVCLSFSLLQFLSNLLPLPGPQLPAKVCAACHLGVSDCHAFQQRCLRSIKKVAKTEVCPVMVLGRSEDEVRHVTKAFQDTQEQENKMRRTVQLQLENRSLLEQASKEYGDSQLLARKPQVIVSSKEVRIAELALTALERQNLEEKKGVEQSGGTEESTWHCSVREEKVEEDESEGEMFPSFGPYQCEICQAIIETKQEFVKHIKILHRGMVDKAVLQSLESDLKKKKKKERRNIKNHDEKKKSNTTDQVQEKSSGKFKLRKKERRKRNQHGGLSDSEDEYIPNKRKDLQLAKPKHVPNDVEVLSKDPVIYKQFTDAANHDDSEEAVVSKTISSESSNTDDKYSPTKVSSLLRSYRKEPLAKEKSESTLENPGKKKANSSHTVARLLAVETPQYEKHPLVNRRLSVLDNDTTFNFKASIAKRYEAEKSVENVKLVEAHSSDLHQDVSKVTTLDICEDVSSSGEKETELLRSSFDRLTQEMAALHGAAGSNTPWREMHDTFFG